jgi:ABC-type transport system involved in multi-copper enzyme maturation permease subunit
MRVLFVLSAAIAALLTVLVILLTVSALRGVDNILFPGLGLVVRLSFFIVLFAVIDAFFILLALFFRSKSRNNIY